MRFDLKAAAHFFVAAAFFAVCVMVAPDYLHPSEMVREWTFWIGLTGAIVFGTAGFLAALKGEAEASGVGHRRRMIALYGMIVCGVGFLGFATAYFWPVPNQAKPSTSVPVEGDRKPVTVREVRDSPTAKAQAEPPTPEEIFKSDFGQFLSLTKEISLKNTATGNDYLVPLRLVVNFDAGAKFLMIFLPKTADAFEIGRTLAAEMEFITNLVSNPLVTSKAPGDSTTISSDDLPLSKLIYIYMERDMTIQEQAALDAAFLKIGFHVQFRGQAYFVLHWHERGFVGPSPTNR